MTKKIVQATSYPPLQRTQGRGTHSFNTGKMRVESWATRPRDDRAGEKPSRFSDGACGVLPAGWDAVRGRDVLSLASGGADTRIRGSGRIWRRASRVRARWRLCASAPLRRE